jgi:predicted phage-related endonuclease
MEKQKDEIDAGIKQAIGENAGIKTSQFVVTWKSQITTRVDTKAIKIEEPEIFNKYSYESKTRVLRVKSNKGESNG